MDNNSLQCKSPTVAEAILFTVYMHGLIILQRMPSIWFLRFEQASGSSFGWCILFKPQPMRNFWTKIIVVLIDKSVPYIYILRKRAESLYKIVLIIRPYPCSTTLHQGSLYIDRSQGACSHEHQLPIKQFLFATKKKIYMHKYNYIYLICLL